MNGRMLSYVQRLIVCGLALGYLSGCGAPMAEVDEPVTSPGCQAPAGKTITDVQSVVDWINAMPKPLSLPCFVSSLPRPLKVFAAISGESVQPSLGDNNPRLFIFLDKITLSVVPDEPFATQPNGEPVDANSNKHNLLEMSFNTQGIKSIKAEIKFPIHTKLPNSAPFDQIAFSSSASECSLCHRLEKRVGEVDGIPVYESDRLRPRESVGLRAMRLDYENCAGLDTSYHCSMLNGIFTGGDVVWQVFPEGLPDIYYR